MSNDGVLLTRHITMTVGLISLRIRRVKFAGFAVYRARLQIALVNFCDRLHFAVITRREQLIRAFKVLIGQSALHHFLARGFEKRNRALAGDAV